MAENSMRTVLISQKDSPVVGEAMARWLASFSDYRGSIELIDQPGGRWKKLKREAKRVGWLRMPDVLAFRLWYKLFFATPDQQWQSQQMQLLRKRYPINIDDQPKLVSTSPNSSEAEAFLQQAQPDIVIAACKHLLKPHIYQIASTGTFVMHPGICPQYRNAHGIFWALAQNDLSHVGMTLLKIDQGIDTGPIYGYFHQPFDEWNESHLVIQRRTTLDSLDQVADTLQLVHAGLAKPLNVSQDNSAVWGQPWLSSHIKWKWNALRRRWKSQTSAPVIAQQAETSRH